MGISQPVLNILIQLRETGAIKNRASVMEIGAQQISNCFLASRNQLNEIGKLFNISKPHCLPDPAPTHIASGTLEHLNINAPLARKFWKWLGFHYASIDIDGSTDSIPIDLNFDSIPRKIARKFDIVTNLGTTEHVANQLNAFKIIHELTAKNGIMIHDLPSQGMFNHGLINYNPKFFWMLARSNGYEWVHFNYTSDLAAYTLPQNIIDNAKPFNTAIIDHIKDYTASDCSMLVVLKKIYHSPFVPPLDVDSGTQTNNKILKKRYWSVFKKKAFIKYRLYNEICKRLKAILSMN